MEAAVKEQEKKVDQVADIKTEDAIEAKKSQIDFKMVTFTLGGKDYGINIMKVKEISKMGKFTYVPNTAPYVKGVYNLRGDIITVIDLRTFFNLPIDTNLSEIDTKKIMNMIILRLEDRVVAVIVDNIDKVLGIASETIQDPHPLFGDVNIKYISGIVEENSKLYVLLNVDTIFTGESFDTNLGLQSSLSNTHSHSQAGNIESKPVEQKKPAEDQRAFIEETLVTFKNFHPSNLNKNWIGRRLNEWVVSRDEDKVQLANIADAEEFLSSFYSPFTGMLWTKEYTDSLMKLIPKRDGGVFNVWNPGCGTGHESYSVCCALKKKFSGIVLKVRSNDNDLIKISTAPGLIVEKNGLDNLYNNYIVEGSKGCQFSKEVKDHIIFEYHDIAHNNMVPKLDLVIARDIISFLDLNTQTEFFKFLNEMVKPQGILLLGKNETMPDSTGWDTIEESNLTVYKRK